MSAWEASNIKTQDRIEFALWMFTNPGQFGRRGTPHPGFREWLAAHDAEVREAVAKEIEARNPFTDYDDIIDWAATIARGVK